MVLFFFDATAPSEICTLSLHDALPICVHGDRGSAKLPKALAAASLGSPMVVSITRSEEHTSELQSRGHLVCRLLLEKKNVQMNHVITKGQSGSVLGLFNLSSDVARQHL